MSILSSLIDDYLQSLQRMRLSHRMWQALDADEELVLQRPEMSEAELRSHIEDVEEEKSRLRLDDHATNVREQGPALAQSLKAEGHDPCKVLAATELLREPFDALRDRRFFAELKAELEQYRLKQPRQQPAAKKSTAKGETRLKWVGALTQHHRYENGECLNESPIDVAEMERKYNVSTSSASRYFIAEFGSHDDYKAACRRNIHSVATKLRELNGENTPHELFKSLPDDFDEDDVGDSHGDEDYGDSYSYGHRDDD